MRRLVIILIGTALLALAGGPPAGAIIGGKVAPEAPPSLGSLQVELPGDAVTPDNHRCGTTLIAPQWVVTASHCAILGNAGDAATGPMRASVRIGSTNTGTGGELVGVDRFYRLGTPTEAREDGYDWLLRDIALLRLERPVRATPIPIASKTPAAGTPARIMGWGSTCSDPAKMRDPQCYPSELRTAETAVQDARACPNIQGSDTPRPLCIGGKDGRPTIGNADSGSPALVQENGAWVIAGVVSGPGTNDDKGPGLYMDLTQQRDWIDSIINNTIVPDAPPTPDVAGAVLLGNCIGSIVRPPGATPDAPAMVLTNGHCVSGDRPAPGGATVNQPSNRTMLAAGRTGESVTTVRADRLVYATMSRTDVAVYRLDSTYAQVAARGATVFDLATTPIRPGDRFSMNTGAARKSCSAEAVVPTVREGDWEQRDSVRYRDCSSVPGESGSPLISPDGRTVVGVNNSSNTDGEKCTDDNPCEIAADGTVTAVKGRSYGQQIDALARCLTRDSIDLSRPGCDLPGAA
ncbi:Peptidase S1 and S6 chymotrypsin/Hap OS=Tsukamurella paurometabola (strain ATCC 8368 / DSM /CCUG 35730 / CIP 100753 / JCM 10117 / KCTC 9821 / NBRC 16120/ NCIMB 702349 / NCTC 13040) OX=521096 GN=Tpau_1101 PE=3 SV=1 [Tsukamurella paurometabola]|uniref:Peptidase S1 and S6 chymotrypsin/Hap n=1 Tax=Tsukamurella paurometabola (strain ATCC 8368 / DSM 20162 / CCUG 35730 / CIP 100753 / JCM 10117 / KCTC 9821 / NBRC 16120 / NCIMB 702349 / NCTC 13040) TaxID=521096 RepID=D5UVE3_TSUPD|nr:trypsin-like serine protease [Tsukamurella paurometabola]ADG77733.1 peptidase S1 and S6 chymotrypsin/Hap [Tsukamurella paurometabola DSM 20162]SUP28540.1 Trypsin [Tsukamurella paurometabola]